MNVGTAVRYRIVGLCSEKGITINKLGTICGVPRSTINNIVSGRNDSTTISMIKKICDGLNIRLIDFFDHELFCNLDQEIQ